MTGMENVCIEFRTTYFVYDEPISNTTGAISYTGILRFGFSDEIYEKKDSFHCTIE